MIHGGDIYTNRIDLDFSVNTNPFPLPQQLKEAMVRGLEKAGSYPEYDYMSLRRAIARLEKYKVSGIVCGNGASELFMAIASSLKPQRAILIAPSFYGYQHCLRAVGCEITYLGEDELPQGISEETDIIFLGNPNNPTGKYIDRTRLTAILETCKSHGVKLVIDECFFDLGLGGYERDFNAFFESYPNAIVVKAFTKVMAIPGIRIGYCLCHEAMRERIAGFLPEWNVSVIADEVGSCCAEVLANTDFLEKSHELIKGEKDYLCRELVKLGIEVFDSDTNFIMLRTDKDLRQGLIEKGILIRDCSNFTGLEKGYYRIAVKDREANTRLIEGIKEL